VKQEEPGQAVALDQPQLLVQARPGFAAVVVAGAVTALIALAGRATVRA